MILRHALPTDTEAADEIYRAAKKFMIENGNPDQWSGDYPSGEDQLLGIERGVSYVVEDGGEVVAAFLFDVGEDPTYKEIFEGEWLNDAPYAFIHRIAVKYHGRGIIDFCFSECFKKFPNIKIDTHEDNIPMQKALERAGFKRCGIIYLPWGDARVAYQKAAN